MVRTRDFSHPLQVVGRLIDDTVGLCARGRADRVDNGLLRALRCSGFGIFQPYGFYRDKIIQPTSHIKADRSPNESFFSLASR